ncbi:aminoglycoside N(3)-acetyltransferase [Streptomyces sp. NBC_01335]|uniref:aminoglycoside N(3)-acetyltransferase n=1 Tax=Streptomyces sp. NBC_01335 TaxID=2903828 RepID=UPI002E159945
METVSYPERLAAELIALGVRPGATLIVHASLRALRPPDRGAASVVAGVRGALGPAGTLVVPAFTPENSDTSRAHLARVAGLTEAERARVRADMPAFDPAGTPAPTMGRFAETVRLTPGARRSGHPQTSFAALGPDAAHLTRDHRADCHLGEGSPLARLYGAGAHALLLGTGFGTFSAFHLAEYRVPEPPLRHYRCVVGGPGGRRWWEYEDVALDDSDFVALGAEFARSAGPVTVRTGRVGEAACTLVPVRDAVDFAVGRFTDGAYAAARRTRTGDTPPARNTPFGTTPADATPPGAARAEDTGAGDTDSENTGSGNTGPPEDTGARPLRCPAPPPPPRPGGPRGTFRGR